MRIPSPGEPPSSPRSRKSRFGPTFIHAYARASEATSIGRAIRINDLLAQVGRDPIELFEKLFGQHADEPLELEVRPYGMYFWGSRMLLAKVEPALLTASGVAMMGRNGARLLKLPELNNMVGMGFGRNAHHEFVHLFNGQTPMAELKGRLEQMCLVSMDASYIDNKVGQQFDLWANSILKDELLARLETRDFAPLEQEASDNLFASPTRIFTQYQPDFLERRIAGECSQPTRDSGDPVHLLELKARTFARRRWLGRYNQALGEVQSALSNRANPSKLRAELTFLPLESWPSFLAGSQSRFTDSVSNS